MFRLISVLLLFSAVALCSQKNHLRGNTIDPDVDGAMVFGPLILDVDNQVDCGRLHRKEICNEFCHWNHESHKCVGV